MCLLWFRWPRLRLQQHLVVDFHAFLGRQVWGGGEVEKVLETRLQELRLICSHFEGVLDKWVSARRAQFIQIWEVSHIIVTI